MVTKKRIWFPGASYHITARGNHKEYIFREERDYLYYLWLMRETLSYYNHYYKILCYCLMSNHVHLIIKTEGEPIWQFMCRLNSKYAKFYNKKYDYIGHLFQGRYFSEIIDNDQQMLETSRYIHLNPVRAKMVKLPEEYKWSSYKIFTEGYDEESISPNIILDYFNKQSKRTEYKEFVEESC